MRAAVRDREMAGLDLTIERSGRADMYTLRSSTPSPLAKTWDSQWSRRVVAVPGYGCVTDVLPGSWSIGATWGRFLVRLLPVDALRHSAVMVPGLVRRVEIDLKIRRIHRAC